jgi:glycosyltransferase involved in cell wall biosynthesis
MKIFLCLHHFLPDFIGGTEMYTLRLAQHLNIIGFASVVLIPGNVNANSEEYIFEGIRVIPYTEYNQEQQKPNSKNLLAGVQSFAEIISRERPNIIHFHELAPAEGIPIVVAEMAVELNIPLMLTFHLSGYTCFTGTLIYKDIDKCDGMISVNRCTQCFYHSKKLGSLPTKILSAGALGLYSSGINLSNLNSKMGTALGFPFIVDKLKNDIVKIASSVGRIVVLTHWYKEILEKNGVPSAKLIYIKQGLTNETQISANTLKITYPLQIVFLGRISELKGVHLLIEAMDKLPDDKITLYIYGQVTEDDYAIACQQNTLNKKNIHWMGTIAAESVTTMLAKYHVLCLPSTFSEMSPLVIQEAFAAGLPVLASDVYGNAEQITEGLNGWLFRFKDSSHLAEKLSYLIENLSRVDEARKHLPVPILFGDIARQHAALYAEVIESRQVKSERL